MSQFKDIANQFSTKTLYALAYSVLSIDYIQDALISLSQEKLKDGEDSEGGDLHTDRSVVSIGGGIYSPQNEKNFEQDFVDLYESGEFYNSFQVIVRKTFFELKGEFKKGGGKHIHDNFQNSYADKATFEELILALREKDFGIFIQKVLLEAAVNNFILMVQKSIK